MEPTKEFMATGLFAIGVNELDQVRELNAPNCLACNMPGLPMARFCYHCGTRLQKFAIIKTEKQNIPAERRQLSILFCDLVNSVALTAGNDPEDVADTMRQFHGVVAAVVERFGGYYERPMGDGGLFYFGYPVAAEDDSERAVAAALEILRLVARMPPERGISLQVRIGIAAGVVVVGDLLGTAYPGGHHVIGDVAALAARLQQAATPGSVLVSDTVHQSTNMQFDYEDLGCKQIRGWTGAMRIWRPLRAIPYSDRFEARLTAGNFPIVGRAAELNTLAYSWEQTCAKSGQVVLLVGEAGIGKSRLAHELTHTLAPPGTAVKRFFCGHMKQHVPLQPIIEQLTHVVGLSGTDESTARIARVEATFASCLGSDAELIADLIGPAAEDMQLSFREASLREQRERVFRALLNCMLSAANREPLIIVFEDTHWSDPTTLELIGRMVDMASARSLLLIVTARPQFRPEWANRSNVRRIYLDPLAPEDGARLVRLSSGPLRLSDAVVADIVERSDGVPLYIEEVTRTMSQPGAADHAVPASIHASLLSSIDRLGPASMIAEVAAVIGREFEFPLLRAVCDLSERDAADSLKQLVASGLVQRTEIGDRTIYVFRHALIRDTAYGIILRARKRTLHARIAEVLELDFATEAAAEPQRLALHYTAASLDRKAAEWWLRAGLQSLQRSAMPEALTQIRRALSLLEPLPHDIERRRLELEILVVYGRVLSAVQGHSADAAGEVIGRARILCDDLEDPPQLLAVLFLQWTHSFFRARLAEARQRADDLLRQATRRHDEVWMVMGYYTLGVTTLLSGDIDKAIGLLREGIERFRLEHRHMYASSMISDPCIVMRTYLSWALVMRGAFGDAKRQLSLAIEEARALPQRWGLAMTMAQGVNVLLSAGGPDAAEPCLDELQRISANVEHYEAVAKIERGWLLAARGDPASGLQEAKEGRIRRVTAGTRLHLPHFLRVEAAMLLQMDRLSEALDVLDAGKQVQTEINEYWDDPEFHRLRGEALVALGEIDKGEVELVAAMHLSQQRSQHLYGLRASISLAESLRQRGATSVAARIVREARMQVEDDPTVPDVRAADRLLARIAEVD